MFMINELAVNLLPTFMHTFFCQPNHLPCTPSIEKSRVSVINTKLADLLPTAERHIGEHKVDTALSTDWEGAVISNPTGQTVEIRYPHPQTIRDDKLVGNF